MVEISTCYNRKSRYTGITIYDQCFKSTTRPWQADNINLSSYTNLVVVD